MIGEGNGESYQPLIEHRLDRQGFQVKLDRGFEEGTYCVYVEFDDLAARVGFAAARRQAGRYCALLKEHLAGLPTQSLGETEDASRSDDPRRRRDLELPHLTFPLVLSDSRFHDKAVKAQFHLAFLRAGQQWDQAQAGEATRRQAGKRAAFREQLEALLEGDAYRHIDAAARQRLLADVTAIAFPPRQR